MLYFNKNGAWTDKVPIIFTNDIKENLIKFSANKTKVFKIALRKVGDNREYTSPFGFIALELPNLEYAKIPTSVFDHIMNNFYEEGEYRFKIIYAESQTIADTLLLINKTNIVSGAENVDVDVVENNIYTV